LAAGLSHHGGCGRSPRLPLGHCWSAWPLPAPGRTMAPLPRRQAATAHTPTAGAAPQQLLAPGGCGPLPVHLSWSRSRPVALWECCPVAPGRAKSSPAARFWGRRQGCPIAGGWYKRGRRGGHRQHLAVRLLIVACPDRGLHPGKDRPAVRPRPRPGKPGPALVASLPGRCLQPWRRAGSSSGSAKSTVTAETV